MTNIKEYFQLGIVKKDGKVISHRNLIKIFINPLLRRLFKKAIASIIEDDKVIGYKLVSQEYPITWCFKINFDYDEII